MKARSHMRHPSPGPARSHADHAPHECTPSSCPAPIRQRGRSSWAPVEHHEPPRAASRQRGTAAPGSRHWTTPSARRQRRTRGRRPTARAVNGAGCPQGTRRQWIPPAKLRQSRHERLLRGREMRKLSPPAAHSNSWPATPRTWAIDEAAELTGRSCDWRSCSPSAFNEVIE